MCRRCGRVADTDLKRKDLRSSRCLGSAVGRLLERTCGDRGAVARACVERKQDLAGRGWRPRKGGGEEDEEADRWGAEGFEEEMVERSASEDESGKEGEGTEAPGEEDHRRGEEGGAAADPAAAAARSSGIASAEVPEGTEECDLERSFGAEEGRLPLHGAKRRRIRLEKFEVKAVTMLDGECEVADSAMPAAEVGTRELPELPTDEALLVQVDVDRRRRKPPRLSDDNMASDVGAMGRQRTWADWPQRGALPMNKERKRKGSGAAAAALPALKKLCTEVPRMEEEEQMEATMAMAGRLGTLEVDDPCDEDPFGHVQADLAIQPQRAERHQEVARMATVGSGWRDVGSARGTVAVQGSHDGGQRTAGEPAALPSAMGRVSEALMVADREALVRPGVEACSVSSGGLVGRESPRGSPQRGILATGARVRRRATGAAGATPPTSKRLRADSPLVDEDVQPRSTAVSPSASARLEDRDPCDEDPFGHIEAELAMQPRLARESIGERRGDHTDGRLDEAGLAARPRATGLRPRALEAAGSEGLGLATARGSNEELQRVDVDERDAKCRRLGPPGEQGADGGEVEGEAAAGPEGPFGRRYTGVISDPVDTASSNGHSLCISGPMIFCNKCGRYATKRVGKALKANCVGSATGAYATRLARLRTGNHPITGKTMI